MDWLFAAFLLVSILHMVEEFFYPGGFMSVMKRFNPRFAPFVTVRLAVIMNGLQLVVAALAMVVGRNALAFSLSIAGLVLLNSVMHVGACIRARGYAPGVVTGLGLYLPLSIYAYYVFGASGQLTLTEGLVSILLGALYQAAPIGYLALAGTLKGRGVV